MHIIYYAHIENYVIRLGVAVTLYEDNVVCMALLKRGYIKGDRTKHISQKLFFTQDLQQNGEIEVHHFFKVIIL